jgi:hypothetical protein
MAKPDQFDSSRVHQQETGQRRLPRFLCGFAFKAEADWYLGLNESRPELRRTPDEWVLSLNVDFISLIAINSPGLVDIAVPVSGRRLHDGFLNLWGSDGRSRRNTLD